MAVHVTETLPNLAYRWTEPPAILSCDNVRCDAPWVTSDGLVSWRLGRHWPVDTFWSETFVIGCALSCLHAAQRRHGPDATWSAPMPVSDWLDTLRSSLDYDPQTTPIGEIRPRD